MAKDRRNLVVYDQNRFERYIALRAWKRQQTVSIMRYTRALLDTRNTNILLVPCKQELTYMYMLLNTIDAVMAVPEGVSGLECWCFKKPHKNSCLMWGGDHRNRAIEFEVCQRTAVRYSVFVKWNNLETLAASSTKWYCNYVTLIVFWQSWEAYYRLHKIILPMFP